MNEWYILMVNEVLQHIYIPLFWKAMNKNRSMSYVDVPLVLYVEMV